MKRLSHLVRSVAVAMLLIIGRSAGAQAFLFDAITAADGLAGDEAFCLLEDREGFIWVGTSTGASRLEGTRIRNFHHDPADTTSLGHDQVNGIAQDANGTIWLATMSGLSRFDGMHGTFRTHRIAATGSKAVQANRMRQVVPIGDSIIWTLTEDGLYRFDLRTKLFRSVQGQPPGAGPAGSCNVQNGLHWDAVREVLWAATSDGLAAWSARTNRWSDHRSQSIEGPWSVRGAVTAPWVHHDTLWFHADHGYTLWALGLGGGELLPQPTIDPGNNKFNLRWQSFDADGTHWLSTWTYRLFHREARGEWREIAHSANEPGAIPGKGCSFFLPASNGDRWFATSDGIRVLRAARRATQLLPHRLSGAGINVLLPLSADTMMAGTDRGVWLFRLSDGATAPIQWTFLHPSDSGYAAANMVRSLAVSRNGMIAVCTGFGLYWIDPSTWRARADARMGSRTEHHKPRSCTFFVEDDDARWVGTWRNGLWRCPFDEALPCERVDTVEGPYGKLPSRMLLCWLSDRTGKHWVGMNDGGGIAVLEQGRWRGIQDGRGANVGGVVRVMAEAPDGRIWLGTHEQGIVVLDPKDASTRFVTRRDGLPGARVMDLHFARDGTLWTVTDRGIARMPSGQRTMIPLPLPKGLDQRGLAEGLAELPDGRVLFGLGVRIVLHDPRIPLAEHVMPRAAITGHQINGGNTLGPPPELELASSRKALALELGATGAMPGAPLLFRYRVLPLDSGWKEIGQAQRIDLFDLPAGKHVIEVAASTDGATWGITASTSPIVVLPPIHATWWFRAGIALLIALAAFIGFRVYLQARLREQQVRFEREQAVLRERERIASDLHDDLGAGLSGLKLRSEMALRMEKDPSQRDQLASLAAMAGELIANLRQMIWAMDEGQGAVHDLLAYTTSYARGYCAQHGLEIDVRVAVGIPDAPLSAHQRRNIHLVLKEALHNCMKHAQASRVTLSATWAEGLSITIADDGIGLPKAADAGTGNGMRNMRKRMQEVGGAFAARSDAGTVIAIHVPLAHP